MKVFLSWSGNRSKEVASLLNDWLCCVIQASRPWISSRDLDRGSLWFGEINDQLKDTSVGIICLTQDNKNRPWILFEAGALAKGLTTSRVCTFLIDLESKDIEDPLAQFNHTFPNKESVFSLVQTLNSTLGEKSLDSRVLQQVFDTYWPQFEVGFNNILSQTDSGAPTKPRAKEDMLGEILETTRALNSRIRNIESEMSKNSVPSDVSIKYGGEFETTDAMRFSRRHLMEIRELARSGVSLNSIIAKYAGRVPTSVIISNYEKSSVETGGS